MTTLTLTISNQTVVITGDNLAVTVGGERESSFIADPAGAVVAAGNDLRELAATASGQIIREGDAPRETGRLGGVASCPDTDFNSSAVAVPTESPETANPKSPRAVSGEISNPQPTSSPDADKAGEPQVGNEPEVGSPATNPIIALRPLCQSPDECAGYGSHTCHSCLKAAESAGRAA